MSGEAPKDPGKFKDYARRARANLGDYGDHAISDATILAWYEKELRDYQKTLEQKELAVPRPAAGTEAVKNLISVQPTDEAEPPTPDS